MTLVELPIQLFKEWSSCRQILEDLTRRAEMRRFSVLINSKLANNIRFDGVHE